MKSAKIVFWLFCLSLAPMVCEAAKTEVRLALSADVARPGETILAGVVLRMPPRWHTYWRNAGDSGAPTKIDWTLPPGVSAGEMMWPIPEKYLATDLTTYVYHAEAVLLVPLTVTSDAPLGPLRLKAAVSWLECETVCVPGKAEVETTLTIGAQSKSSSDAALIENSLKKLPKEAANLDARAWWSGAVVDDTRTAVIEWNNQEASADGDFFPFGGATFEVAGETKLLPAAAGKIRIAKQVKKLEGSWPKELSGLLVGKAGTPSATAAEIQLALGADESPGIGPAASSSAQSLLGMLGLAFLGGLILNIMPCVLPVIALKILGFVQQSKESPGRVKKLGFIYALGVLFSFVVLAGLVIAVQQAGRSASWGMQFQNPRFVIVMTTLVTLVALNLFGVFEVNLGGRAMEAAGGLAAKDGSAGAFFNGVLATALATPCTAPYLSVALGFAFAQPARIIVLMFLVMGLGLAAPYLVLSWFPKFLKLLPKPGMWMAHFKVIMGFPMLATALWLLSLTTRHFGSGGPLWTGLFLVTVAFAVWIWGEFVQRGRKHQRVAMAMCLLVLAAGYGYGLEQGLHWRSPAKIATGDGVLKHSADEIDWQPWSAAALEKARGEGRPVLVDFTADWCVTCQANKKSSLEISSVRAKLKEVNAVALLGDYTLEDRAITAELKRFERAGVPLVLVYPKDPKQPPVVLPALLTPGIVLEALDKASR